MKSIYFFIIVMIFMSACSRTYPPYKLYELQPQSSSAAVQQRQQVCQQKSIRIARVIVPQILMHKKMYYTQGLESYAYSESRWTQRPVSFITSNIVQSLENSKIFASVISDTSKAKTSYLLESRVDTFMQYYIKQNSASFVKISVTFFLLDAKSAKVLKSMHFQKEMKCKSADARGGVEALNQLLSEALKALVIWLESEECR
jgi:cholesterol transport system auxiliary component